MLLRESFWFLILKLVPLLFVVVFVDNTLELEVLLHILRLHKWIITLHSLLGEEREVGHSVHLLTLLVESLTV